MVVVEAFDVDDVTEALVVEDVLTVVDELVDLIVLVALVAVPSTHWE